MEIAIGEAHPPTMRWSRRRGTPSPKVGADASGPFQKAKVLHCVAHGCPTLPKKPFTGKRLDAELDRETSKFFSESRNLRVDHANKTIHAIEILEFYTEDFTPAHAPSLIAYINRYVADPIPENYAVRFSDYDWTIANSRRQGRPPGTALVY